LLKVLGPKTVCPSFPTESKYKEITTLKLLLVSASFGGVGYVKGKIKQLINLKTKDPKKKTFAEKPVIQVWEREWSGG